MKKALLLLAVCLLGISSHALAQVARTPIHEYSGELLVTDANDAFANGAFVNWEVHTEHLQDDNYLVIFDAHVKDSWYLYSQTDRHDGQQRMEFIFYDNPSIKLASFVDEYGYPKSNSEGAKVYYDRVRFQCQVTKQNLQNQVMKVEVQYVTCSGNSCASKTKYFDVSF